MTQPQTTTTPPPEQSNAGTVVAVAAIGLALIAIESQVRQRVEEDIAAALTAIAAIIAGALLTPPIVFTTGIELLADPKVHAGLTSNLATAKLKVAKRVRSGYDAAAQVALARARRELDDDITMPVLDNTMDVIDRDMDTMFRHAEADIANKVRLAFDGTQGPDAPAVRPTVARQAVTDAGKKLQNRAGVAAATAVQQGSSDAQQAIWSQHAMSTGSHNMRKRWVVTSTTPCDMCLALNGTIVTLDAEFDHDAGSDTPAWRPVWRNLLGPPRHPNCRCQLELVTN